jgi:outer membrane protein assembly factor BamB
VNRRGFLAATGAAVVGSLAGCGYRPGGGGVRWTRDGGRFDGVEAGDKYVVAYTSAHYGVPTGDKSGTDPVDSSDIELVRYGEIRVLDRDGTKAVDPLAEFRIADLVVVDGAAFAGVGGNELARISLSTGKDGEDGDVTERWRTTVDGFAAIDDEGAYASTSIDALVTDHDAVYAVSEGLIAAVDRADGTVRWSRKFDGKVLTLASRPSGAYVVVDGATERRVLALGTDGAERWRKELPTDRSDPVLLVDPDGLYVFDGRGVRSFDHGGRRRWHRDWNTDPTVDPAVHAGTIYYVFRDEVYAVSTEGERFWQYEVDSDGAPKGRLAAGEDGVYVATEDRPADGNHLLAIEGGSRAWEVSLDSSSEFRHEDGPFALDDTLVVWGTNEVRGYRSG